MKPLFEQIAAMQDIIRADEPAPKKKDCRWCGGTGERGEGGGGCSWCDPTDDGNDLDDITHEQACKNMGIEP